MNKISGITIITIMSNFTFEAPFRSSVITRDHPVPLTANGLRSGSSDSAGPGQPNCCDLPPNCNFKLPVIDTRAVLSPGPGPSSEFNLKFKFARTRDARPPLASH